MMAKEYIYIPIDNITSKKSEEPNKPTKIEIKENTPVYQRNSGGSYTQSGVTTSTGVTTTPPQNPTYISNVTGQTYYSQQSMQQSEQQFLAQQQAELQRQQEATRQAQAQATQVQTQQQKLAGANVYYSPVQGWKPQDQNAVVVYIDRYGKTTGESTIGKVQEGISVIKGNKYQIEQEGKTRIAEGRELLSKQAKERYYYRKTQGEKGEKFIYDNYGNIKGVESEYFGQSIPYENYIKEVNRLKEVLPQVKYLQKGTGELLSEKKKVMLGDIELAPEQFKVYTDPRTGSVITDINKYLIEERIPTGITPKDKPILRTKEDFWKLIEERIPTYDIISLEFIGIDKKGGVLYSGQTSGLYVGGTYNFSSKKAFKESFINILTDWKSTESAFDLALIGSGISGGRLFSLPKKLLNSPLAITIGTLDVVGAYTGTNKYISETLKLSGLGLQSTSLGVKSQFLKYPMFITGVGIETISYLPAQSKKELILDLSLGGAFVSKSRLISYPVKSFIVGASGYQVVTGETAGQKGLGVLGLLALSPDIVKGIRVGSYRLSPDYVKTRTDITGIKYSDVDLGYQKLNIEKMTYEIFKNNVKVEFIPPRKADFAGDIFPIKTMASDLALKTKPELPKVTAEQKAILDIVKQEGDIVSGSFAQQTLIKNARQFKDLDILSYEPMKLASKIQSTYPNLFRVEQKTITDSPLGKFDIYKVYSKETGKQLADIDPIKFGEEGLAIFSQQIKVEGLKLLSPDIRLTSKVLQSARPLVKEKKLKVAKDIAQLTGRKELETSPSLLRGYGLTKEQQKLAFLEGDFFATHGGMDIIPRFSKEIILGGVKVGSPKLFYYTPSKFSEGIAYARTSRMFPEEGQASLRDILKGEKITFFGGRKQVLFEVGKLGDEFIQPNIVTSEIEVARVLPKEGTKLKILKRFKTIIKGEPIEIAYVGREKITKEDLSKIDLNKIKNIYSDTTIRKRINQVKVSPTLRTDFREDSSIRNEQQVKRIFQPIRTDLDLIRKNRTINPRLERTYPVRNNIVERNIVPTRIEKDIITERTIPRIEKDIITPRVTREPIRRDLFRLIRIPTIPQKVSSGYGRKRQPVLKQVQEYGLFVRRRRKFTQRGVGTKAELKRLGVDIAETTLARTFRIKPTGRTREVFSIDEEYEPEELKFREFKIRKGKTIYTPEQFIQRQRFALGTESERRELQIARQQQRELNRIMNI